MLDVLGKLSADDRAAAMKEVDKVAREMELSRKLNRIIVHVDMDAFYAAVEMRDDPELKHSPMAVGSNAMLVSLCLVIYLVLHCCGVPSSIPQPLMWAAISSSTTTVTRHDPIWPSSPTTNLQLC